MSKYGAKQYSRDAVAAADMRDDMAERKRMRQKIESLEKQLLEKDKEIEAMLPYLGHESFCDARTESGLIESHCDCGFNEFRKREANHE